jgi:SAM-dependent methyltransferase
MIKLNLGCGARNFGSDWIHIDGGDYPHLDSNDIVDLPFENDMVDLIYASHVFEYFDREEGKEILQKWYSKLKPNGIIRLAVPDFEVIANLYSQKKYKLSNFVGPLYGRMKMGSTLIYHKTVYDFYDLEMLLKSVKYRNVKRYDWRTLEHYNVDDHSHAYLPHMDKDNGTLISLNIEAIK